MPGFSLASLSATLWLPSLPRCLAFRRRIVEQANQGCRYLSRSSYSVGIVEGYDKRVLYV